MAADELLLLIDTPIASPKDLKQLVQMWTTSVERHRRFIPRSPGRQPEAVPDTTQYPLPLLAKRQALSLNKRRLAQAFASDEGFHSDFSTNPRVKVSKTDRSVCEAEPPPRKVARRSQNQSSANSSDLSPPDFSYRMAVPVDKLYRTRGVEDMSLMAVGFERDTRGQPPGQVTWYDNRMRESARTPILYTLTLNLIPDLSVDPDLASYASDPYRLAIDTGDCSFWLLEEEFSMTEWSEFDQRHIVSDWPEDAKEKIVYRSVIPPGDGDDIQDKKSHEYSDGMTILWRWSDKHDLPFRAPSWSWRLNRPHSSVILRIPRILARAVPRKFGELCDGNLGMGAPGWRDPWGKEVESEDRLTFWDVLQGIVETPSQAMLRLLMPDGRRLSRAGPRVQSFLYYGKGSPCGYLEDQTLHLPKFSPPLYIFTSPASPGVYQHWQLQLLSIALLKPVRTAATRNYDSGTISDEEWVENRITLRGPRGQREIRTIFDSGSGTSILPDDVLMKIAQEWFYIPSTEIPRDGPLWHWQEDNFANHDMLFEFMDSRGTTHTLRCSAESFLSSPWTHGRVGKWSCLARKANVYSEVQEDLEEDIEDPEDPEDIPWVLGMNFFWAAIVKMDGGHRGEFADPAQATPTVQFAPQRIVRGNEVIADPWKLQLHADLPPRLEAVRLGGNQELYPHEQGVVF